MRKLPSYRDADADCDPRRPLQTRFHQVGAVELLQSTDMTDAAIQIAETVQTASIKRAPSPNHDINPSTAASRNQPIATASNASNGDEIPYSAIRPRRRKTTLPPLPDLRFEQSYLASISNAESTGRVLWITVRDQVRIAASSLTPCKDRVVSSRLQRYSCP